MGVKGLWRLLLPVGRRISIETLEGQILAIDASIWLTQFLTVAARQRELDLLGDDVHGNKDGNGDGINNTTTHGKAYSYDYLVGFLRRLCKLRYQGVRPVLVFDGETPEIKKREIRARNRRRKRKLGESFYLGGNSNNNGNGGDGDGDKKNNTEEDEEMLEATRRMAKRILAKQLRTGKLVTTKNKHKKLKTTNDAKPNLNVAIASAAYAPGFYDPDAAVVVAPQAQAEQGNGASHATDKNDGDDDDNHLLRDDYQTNPLQEEINDWDRPIVVDSNDENNSNTNNNNTNPLEKKDRKNGSSRRFAEASNHHHFNFHAGDGTKFRVQSVADLPESTRKDVIEDARKQRRLASRREFMKVASDPDGLSSCQLRNFLKSTKLNRDIVTMAQAAKHKAEEEAKIVKGNGILFEKDVDESIYKNKNSTNTARSCRQHYRSGAARNKAKKSNSGMMRMFHHKDQPQKGNAVGNDDIDEDDEHDFRKARNNHYLSGGLRFVNTGDDAEDKDDEDVEEDDSTNLKSNTLPTITSEDDGGGFVLAVMDGSDKPSRNKTTIEKTSMNSGGVAGQIIEIDIISSSESESENESDGNDSEANRKPRATKPKNKSTKAAQELRDESLARALQSIEEEECIEIDDSDEDSGSDGGFLENSTALKERGIGVPQIQQERDDARLARTLQNAEYGEEEDQSGSGGFLAEANENNIDDEENMGDGGGFLVPTKENNTDKEANSDVGVEFLVPTDTDIMNDKEEHSGGDGGFLIPAKNDMFNTLQSQSQSPTISSHECIGSENDAKMGSKEAPFPRQEWNPFLLNSIGANNTSNSLFDLSKQQKVKKSDINLFVCRESSEDEEEEDIDWEDGNDKNDSSIHCKEDSKKESNTPGAIDKKEYMSPERNKLSDLLQNDVKNAAHTENLDDNADEDNRGEVNREDGDCKPRQPNEACNLEAPVLQKKSETTTVHTQDTDENNGDQDDDDEVDWEDGVEEANDIKPVVIDISTVKNGTRQSNRTGLYEIRETSDKDEEEIDWEEGGAEAKKSTQEVIDLSSGKEAAKHLPKTTLNSADLYTKETDDKDDKDVDEVDWEDGDDESIQSNSEVIDLCEENKPEDSFKNSALNEADDDDDEVDWEDGNAETRKNKTEVIELCEACEERKTVKLSIRPALNSFDTRLKAADGNSNDKINRQGDCNSKVPTTHTEEIDGARGKTHHNSFDQETEEVDRKYSKKSSKYFNAIATKPLTHNKTIDMDDDFDSDDLIEWEGGETEGSRTIVDGDDWGSTKTQSSDQVAAALEHAQGTAANLTDWAGRAFRRAIAQHAMENGMEIPESAKPGVLKNTRSDDMDQDEPVNDQENTLVRAAQRTTSQRSTQSRNEDSLDRGASGDKIIDNSSWLDTVDTATNTYAEGYTVALQEGNSSDRLLDATTGGITEEMRSEVMQLLRLFGIPYVVAPSEAEAQCVELERLGLVDGIVTEDSDTFVFGGQVIYKNIFDDKKYVEVYHAKDASEEMNLTQDSLVALAMLLGGDYTEGVKGVGIVNGMEVLQAFDVAQDCEAGLKRFRKWLDGFDPNDLTKKNLNTNEEKSEDAAGGIIRSKKEQLFHRKHHTARTRWIAPKHFPDAKVLNAYLNPVVDTSTERFSWGIPDLNGLIAFCHGHMGLVATETERLITPIIQRMEEGSMRQTRIDSFMRYEDGIKFAKIQSKRLRQVLGLSPSNGSTAAKTTAEQQSRRKRFHTTATAPTTSWNEDEENDNDDGFCEYPESEEIFASMDAASSNVNAAIPVHDTTFRANVCQPPMQPQPQPPKKKYTGKKSLAALSSAAASTVAIASSSKNDDVPSSTTDGPLGSVSYHPLRTNNGNMPKKAPPAYQKQSSATMLDEEGQKDNASTEPLDGANTKTNTYEVINPSMI